jgi:hypothetical protein
VDTANAVAFCSRGEMRREQRRCQESDGKTFCRAFDNSVGSFVTELRAWKIRTIELKLL